MEKKFTVDFHRMVGLTIWNSFGFFFLDFLIPYVAASEIRASGTEMGFIFSVRMIGYFIIAPITPFIFSISVELLLIPFYILAIIKITPYLAEIVSEKSLEVTID